LPAEQDTTAGSAPGRASARTAAVRRGPSGLEQDPVDVLERADRAQIEILAEDRQLAHVYVQSIEVGTVDPAFDVLAQIDRGRPTRSSA